MSPPEASTKGLVNHLAALGQAHGARVLCPVPEVTGEVVHAPLCVVLLLWQRVGPLLERFVAACGCIRFPHPTQASLHSSLAAAAAVPPLTVDSCLRTNLTTVRYPHAHACACCVSRAGGLVEPPVVQRFVAGLEAAGAAAVRVPAYLTTSCSAHCCTHDAMLLQQGGIDAIAFSSTAEAQGLCQLFGGKQALVEAIQQHGVVLAAHGPYTAAGASDVLGLPVTVVSKNFSTFDGLVAALAEALS